MSIRSMFHRTSAPVARNRHRGNRALEQALAHATSTTQRDELLFLKSTR